MSLAREYTYLDQLNALSSQTFLKLIEQQVYQRSFLFRKLRETDNIKFTGGQYAQLSVRAEELGIGGFIDPDIQRENLIVDTRTPITEDYAYYAIPISILWSENSVVKGKLDSKGGQLVALATEKVKLKAFVKPLKFGEAFKMVIPSEARKGTCRD